MVSRSETAFKRPEGRSSQEIEGPPRVAGLMWSLLKSGESVFPDSLYVSREGFKPSQESPFADRSFMIIDANNKEGKLVTQREKARLALLQVSVDGIQVSLTFRADRAADELKQTLSSPEILTISFDTQFEADETHSERPTKVHDVPNISGIDQGDQVAEWLSAIVGKPVRLVFQKPSEPRHRTETIPGLEELATILRFQDSYPATALSYTVLDLFNQRLATEHPEWPQFEPIHFRMNVLIAGKFNEHQIVGKFLKIGDVYFYVQRPKERCPMPAVDPETGIKRGQLGFGSDYQVELRQMHEELGIPESHRLSDKGRLKPLLGVDLIPVNEGYINVNDAIEVLDELPPK